MLRTITPLLSIVIALFIFFFFTQSTFLEVRQIQEESNQYAQAVQKATELSSTLDELLSLKESHGADKIERLEALVPTKLDEVKILADLSDRARAHNMLFGNVSITDEGDNNNRATEETSNTISYAEFISSDISSSLIGNYDQFKSFLEDLERSLVMTEVIGINFSAGNGALQQYEVTVRVYALPAIK